jgi:hypothetical protein
MTLTKDQHIVPPMDESELTQAVGRRMAAAPLTSNPQQHEQQWMEAAHTLGEALATVGPHGYYLMTPAEWLAWALAQVRASDETPACDHEWGWVSASRWECVRCDATKVDDAPEYSPLGSRAFTPAELGLNTELAVPDSAPAETPAFPEDAWLTCKHPNMPAPELDKGFVECPDCGAKHARATRKRD